MRLLAILLISSLSYGQFLAEDKILHFEAGGLIAAAAFPTVYAFNGNNKKKAFVWSMVSVIAIGSLKEISDSQQAGNKFDGEDLVFTVAGGFLINFVYVIVIPNRKK